MATFIDFVSRIEIILYVIAGVGVFFSIRKLTLARQLRRVAVFGLEKEKAQQDQRSALSTIAFLFVFVLMVYAISNILEPNLTESDVAEVVPTPAVFVTPEQSATQALVLYPTITPTPGLPPSEAEAVDAPSDETIDGCQIIGSNIQVPSPGTTLSGQVTVEGEANVFDFQQYKFEVRGGSTGDQWIVVGTFSSPKTGFLGTWDSTSLAPGNYTLRLVVSQNSGNIVTPCEVPIVIASGVAPPPSDQ